MSEHEAMVTLERGILWVPHPAILWQRVGGMLIIERHLFTAYRAGIKTLWIATPKPAPVELSTLRIPEGMTLHWTSDSSAAAADNILPPYLGLSSDHFIRTQTLSHIIRQKYPESVYFHDESMLSVAQVVLKTKDSLSRISCPLPAGTYWPIEAPIGSEETISWLLASGPKSQDGFMAKNFDRHISLAVSRKLLDTPITPNMMTVFSTLLGLTGAFFFLGSSRGAYVLGALLVWLHSVLDGCDGELARIRFQESSFGSDLDFWGDNLVHLALFTFLGYGFWLTNNGVHTLVLAGVADLGVLASAWTAWEHRRKIRSLSSAPTTEAGVTQEKNGPGLTSKLSRLENTLAQRDFIYLLVFLAFIDCVYEFLWAAAIGGLLYFLVMIYLRRINENEYAR